MKETMQQWLKQVSIRWIMLCSGMIMITLSILLASNTLIYNAFWGPFPMTEENLLELSDQQQKQDNYMPFVEKEGRIEKPSILRILRTCYHDGKRFYFQPPEEVTQYYGASYSTSKWGEERYIDVKYNAIVKNVQRVMDIKNKVMLCTTKHYMPGQKGGFLIPVGEKLVMFAEQFMNTQGLIDAPIAKDIIRIGMYDNRRFNTIFFNGIRVITGLLCMLIIWAGIQIVRYGKGYANMLKHPNIKRCKKSKEFLSELPLGMLNKEPNRIETENWRIYKGFWSVKIIKRSKYFK